MNVVDIFKAVVRQIEVKPGAFPFEYCPPASETEVGAAKNVFGIRFPEDVRQLYLWRNGTRRVKLTAGISCHPGIFCQQMLWMPLDDSIDYWRMSCEIESRVDKSIYDGMEMGSGPVKHDRFYRPAWIPIAKDNSRYALYIDMDPGVAGQVGQLIGMETSETPEYIAPSVSEYLRQLCFCIETNRLVRDGARWVYEPAKRNTFMLSHLCADMPADWMPPAV